MKIFRWAVRSVERVTPRVLRNIIDPEKSSIERFVKLCSKEVKKGSKVLDVGAGSCPYKKYFSHTKYEACDFDQVFDKSSISKLDFVCDITDMPRKDNSYDAILCTQVLEHVPDPQEAVAEMARVLKPGGKMFVTVPQGWGIHGQPHNYFYFTTYGLSKIFNQAKLKTTYIKERGGIFSLISAQTRIIPGYLFFQVSLLKNILLKILLTLVLFPIYLVLTPICCLILPIIFYLLDCLDQRRYFTLGYSCYLRKIKS